MNVRVAACDEADEALALAELAEAEADAEDPVYVNFTSGSTGAPKGVTICHRSIIDFIPHFTNIFGIQETDIMGNQAPFDFDVSVKDIFSGIYTGAKVQIIPRSYFSNPTKLMDYLCDHDVTVLVWAVSAMCFVSIRKERFSHDLIEHSRAFAINLPCSALKRAVDYCGVKIRH